MILVVSLVLDDNLLVSYLFCSFYYLLGKDPSFLEFAA